MGDEVDGRRITSRVPSDVATNLVYEIARYDVRTESEVLIERLQLLRRNDELWCRVNDQPEVAHSETDVLQAIEADPALSEIRADQVTRITGESTVLAALPFMLSVPGESDDFDEAMWSDTLAADHTTQDYLVQPGVNRVLYVDGDRWCPWPTSDGERMLPEDWPMIRLAPQWGRLSFCEGGSMTSGLDESIIGLVTPVAVASATNMDMDEEDGHVLLWRRGVDPADDAAMFLEWLLEGGLVPHYFPDDEQLQAMLAQLFVEASVNDRSGVVVPGSELAQATGTELGFGDGQSSEWTLELGLTPDVVEAVLGQLAERGPRFRAMVTSVRDLDSEINDVTKNHRFAIFPAGSIESTGQANDLVCALSATSEDEPSPALVELLDELNGLSDDFLVVGAADSRGVVLGTSSPQDGPLGHLLRCTMALDLAVYDVELFRLYDPAGRVEIQVSLGALVTLPYLTRPLLQDLILRPTWPDPDHPFVIIEREDQVFVQAYRNEDGTYQLEYRNGDEANHFAVQTADIGRVVDVMWAWTIEDATWRTAVPWERLEFEDEDPADEESEAVPPSEVDTDDMYVGRHVELLNERREDGSWLNLDANLLPDGTLRIIGQDLGPVAEAISSDGEYEYFYTIAAEDVPALVVALGGQPDTDVMDLLRECWSGGASYGLGAAITSSGVKHHFTNYY